MTDLKRAAKDRGLMLDMGQTTREGLTQLRKPLIAHLDLVGIGAVTGGHFVVVTATNSSGVAIIDSPLAE